MRLPDVLGVLGALVVGGLLTVLLLASAMNEPPALPTPTPPTIPPIPTAPPTAVRSALPTAAPSPGASPSLAEGVQIGQVAPPIELPLTDGSVINTADYRGAPMWINFMATWCPQCIDELPMMERFGRQLEGSMTILLVDVGESPEVVEPFIESLNVTLPVALDEDSVAQREWGTYALPVHVFIDADGVVQQIIFGGAPRELFVETVTLFVPEFVDE